MQRCVGVVENAPCSCWKSSWRSRWFTHPTSSGVRTPRSHASTFCPFLSSSFQIDSFITSEKACVAQLEWRGYFNASPVNACFVFAARRDHWSRAAFPTSLKKRALSSLAANNTINPQSAPEASVQQQPPAVLLTEEKGFMGGDLPAAIAPSLRVREWDVEEMERRARQMVKSNNFYGKMLLGFLLFGGVVLYISYAASDVSSGLIRHLDGLLELIYKALPENFPSPEDAHRMVMWLASRGYLPLDLDRDDPALSVNVKGLIFHTPVGLAAGFDKDAEAPVGFCK
ncbi:hypothetical protein Esti_002760 [Eimeria stiedai]